MRNILNFNKFKKMANITVKTITHQIKNYIQLYEEKRVVIFIVSPDNQVDSDIDILTDAISKNYVGNSRPYVDVFREFKLSYVFDINTGAMIFVVPESDIGNMIMILSRYVPSYQNLYICDSELQDTINEEREKFLKQDLF